VVCPTEIDENIVPASDILAALDHIQYLLACHGRRRFAEWRRVGGMPGLGGISRGHLRRADTVDFWECEI
jgi:hypothetical protein